MKTHTSKADHSRLKPQFREIRKVESTLKKSTKKLTIIVTLRIDSKSEYLISRLKSFLKNLNNTDTLEFLFVNSGSNSYYTNIIKDIIGKSGKDNVRIVYHNSEGELFSIGAARDFGAQHARGDFLIFQDIDLCGEENFYDKVLNEINALNMKEYVNEFFVIPCFYLSQEGSVEFLEDKSPEKFRKLYLKFIEGESNFHDQIIRLATVTSVLVCQRLYFLSVGGHSKSFYGHGYEDFEMLYRLARNSNKYHRSKNHTENIINPRNLKYEGIRAFLSMWGIQSLSNSLFLVHIWHPTPKTSYSSRSNTNKNLLEKKIKEFDSDKIGKSLIPALPDKNSLVKTLILNPLDSLGMLSIKKILPYLGDFHYRNENSFRDQISFGKYLKKNSFDQVFFLNPYGNEHRLNLYDYCRNNDIRFIVHDRGALPNSWFFDRTGFNAESKLYDKNLWNVELSSEQIFDTEDYIDNLINSEITLEDNNPRLGRTLTLEALDKKYKIDNKKILFIPFQRPNDTVIKKFSGNIEDVEDFCKFIDNLWRSVDPEEWIFICKKHPLEDENPYLHPSIVFVDSGTHIYDLISVADKILLINSGVGVLSMLFNKHVGYLGQTFYGDKNINSEIRNLEDALVFLNSEFTPDRKSILKFIHHLKNSVYSYGAPMQSIRRDSENNMRSVTIRVDFEVLRGVDDSSYFFKYRNTPVQWNSMCYSYYLPSILEFSELKKKATIMPKNVKVTPERVILPKAESKSVIESRTHDASQNKSADTITDLKSRKQSSKFNRKLRKLIRDPYRFFKDINKN